jgi:adenine-specific DNA-methyltransferase
MSITYTRSIDEIRRIASTQLDQNRRGELGQFLTPSSIADFMASLFCRYPKCSRLLDPGAGVGSLSESFIRKFLQETNSGSTLDVTTFEIDPLLKSYLDKNLKELLESSQSARSAVTHISLERDFVTEGSFRASFNSGLYTHVILNPPYKKIAANSQYRKLLHELGIEAPNLYVVFLTLAVLLSEKNGEIVAIVPRSFCNGTYFRQFRKWLFQNAALVHIHVFESRKKAFQDDDVLQENIIIKLVRSTKQDSVTVSESKDSTFDDYKEWSVDAQDVINKNDTESYIRIPSLKTGDNSNLFLFTLDELGIEVSTGPIVDFRVKSYLLKNPNNETAPLLYAHHFSDGNFLWPRVHKKPNAIIISSETKKFLFPKGWYVVTKRFSSKEEKHRIVAGVINPNKLPTQLYGFENHLNVIHSKKRGLEENLVYGLALFLNSSIIDSHFRTFSGHTQVNATDLRTMRFPSAEKLSLFGKWSKTQHQLTQEKIDKFIESYASK